MRRILKRVLGGTMLLLLFASIPASPAAAQSESPCAVYSDDFTEFNPHRWYDTAMYAEGTGAVAVRNGQLELRALHQVAPTELQVYALFLFEGEFDFQVDYEVTYPETATECRFNAGVVLQTPGDQMSYKFYISKAPGKSQADPFHRFRVDEKGEKNVMLFKDQSASIKGTARITRKHDQLSYYELSGRRWDKMFQIRIIDNPRLRLRFKLQNGNEDNRELCPVSIRFDNFRVNSCQNVIDD